MTCNCITEIEALDNMKAHKLDVAIMLRGNALVAETYTQLDRRDNGRKETRSGQPKIFAHTYCPFCGERYQPIPAKEAADAQQD